MKEYPKALAQAILTSMTEGVIISDVGGNITDMNSAAMGLHGFSETSGVPRKHYADFAQDVEVSLPDGQAVPSEQWPIAKLMRGETFTGYELIIRDKRTGREWRNVYSGSRVSDSNGRVVRLVLTLHDVSGERTMRRLLEEREQALRDEQRYAATEIEKARANQWLLLSDVLRNVTDGKLRLCRAASELPPIHPRCGEYISLNREGGISGLRHQAQAAAAERGFEDARWQDLVTAVGEAAMNAIVHGGGGEACVCGSANKVQVWIEDKGEGIMVDVLPNATLGKGYTTAGSLGQGMKLMLQTIDRLYLLTGAAGTTVVLEQDRIPERPYWLDLL